MKVYAFGSFIDDTAWRVADGLSSRLPKVKFVKTSDPFSITEDLKGGRKVVILDVVENLDKVKTIPVEDLKGSKIFSPHDFDLSSLLQILGKVEKNMRVEIIGIPERIDDGVLCDVAEKLKDIV